MVRLRYEFIYLPTDAIQPSVMRRIQKHHGKAFLSAAIATLSIFAAAMVLERSENRRFQQQQRADALDRLITTRACLEG